MATVGGMPKMTDYVREGFRRRQRPWQRVELPEWWNVAIWAGAAGIIAILLAGALNGGGSATTNSGSNAPRYAPQTLNPASASAPPSSRSTPGPTASPSVPATASRDFTDSTAVQIAVTGGGATVVPAGARNLALAAARAAANGAWTGIPMAGAARPTAPPPAPSPGTTVRHLTVEDPAVTGNTRYRFAALVRRTGARTHAVRILVEPDQDGYVVRGR
jgi:hypothetical protein